ncbi:MAG: leucine--tRNA ligase [Chloroflexota bacterium]
MANSEPYIPQEIEPKWQKRWEADKIYRQVVDWSRPKHYALTMLPYPSGDLHIGHWWAMAPSDARARYMRMKGYNVLFPMGFDAFGLPAENAAIQRGIHPAEWTYRNIERMRQQLRSMGAMFDWEREIITSDPEYYKWTQWFFLQFYKHGLAYKAWAAVDFCPHCNTTLAREQVVGEDRRCERCGTPVIKKELEQWFFKITAYAEELLDFSKMEWPERVVNMQRNWIGRSEGAEITFTSEQEDPIVVFTTRPDTLYGATFVVLAPEHPLVAKLTTPEHEVRVQNYVNQARRQSEIDRLAADRPKTGVFTGAYARHPLTGERLPIFVGDYVLMTYGTGAIMGVPAHDERDFAFAQAHGLPIPVVIAPPGWNGQPLTEAYTEPGIMVNSGPFNGLPSEEGKAAITRALEERGLGKAAVTYRLRDWLISRQRYWGAPIPIIYCPACGTVPVPEDQLPVLLPMDVDFRPTGESPLKFHAGFRYTTCPNCGGPAERETDTMDTFMCSAWYQYRYLSPHDDQHPWDPQEGRYWLPVDQYTGGIEHATMHLLYTRFFTKVLRDIGLVNFDEPMLRLYNQGIILGEDGEKMSKSRGNVVAPDDLVARYGSDTVRAYLMFLGRWDQGGPWSSKGIEGVRRWLYRVWDVVLQPIELSSTGRTENKLSERDLRRWTHRTIKRVSDDLETFSFNTAIAALMEFTNALAKAKETPVVYTPAWDEAITTLLLLMAPFTPHIAEELWTRTGRPYSIHQQRWPVYDAAAATAEMITLVVQVNGKVRARIQVPADVTEEQAREAALASEGVRRHLNGKAPKKIVYVPGRLVNIVV